MALLALYLGMQSGERETCPGVIELPGGIFPVRAVVALRAIGAQAAVVSVLVAGGAGRAQSQKGPAQIVDLDRGPLGARNIPGSVTEITADSGVFALQYIASLLVVEILRIKLDQLEVGSVVFRVAARAFLARSRLHSISGVQPLAGSQTFCDLGMAVQTLEDRLAPKFVTGGTLRSAFQ